MADEKQTGDATAPESQTAPSPENVSGVRDRRVRPEGVVPKQAQGYVVAGLAVLILMAVMFSKNHAKPAPKETAPSPLVASTDLNQRKIQELEQDLSADQRQIQQQTRSGDAAGVTPNVPAPNGAAMPAGGVASPATQLQPPATTAEPPRDPVADAEKALAFKARFASNLVSADDVASRPLAESAVSADNAPARSSSLPQAIRSRAHPGCTRRLRGISTSSSAVNPGD